MSQWDQQERKDSMFDMIIHVFDRLVGKLTGQVGDEEAGDYNDEQNGQDDE